MLKKIDFHFSVDDVFKSFIEITDKNIKLKDHWFFSYLSKINKKYNIKIALYLFFEGKVNGKIRNLTEVRDLRKELKGNWIFFGAHALNTKIPPHKLPIKTQKSQLKKIYREITRFAGRKYFARKVRLHEYSESYELNKDLKNYNINTLFTTDKKIGAHRLPTKNKNDLIEKGITIYKNQKFIRTDFRVEDMAKNSISRNINNINKILKKRKFLTIYSHEYELKRNICRKNFVKNLNSILKFYKIRSNLP